MSKLDNRDEQILQKRIQIRQEDNGIQVGDFVKLMDGTVKRVAHDWGDRVQLTTGGSFYFGNGYTSYSGGLEPGIDRNLKDTGETQNGRFWFFHHDYAVKDGGIDVEVPVRVFQVKA